MNAQREELLTLANLMCEEKLADAQKERLQEILRSSKEQQLLFIEFVQLHGQLVWDAGLISGSELLATDECGLPELQLMEHSVRTQSRRRNARRPVAIATACLAVAVLIGILFRNDGGVPQIAESSPVEDSRTQPSEEKNSEESSSVAATSMSAVDGLDPLPLQAIRESAASSGAIASVEQVPTPDPQDSALPEISAHGVVVDDAAVVAEIDRLIRTGWEENEVAPATEADDYEWARRTYLTLTGRIPSISEVREFVSSGSTRKRLQLVDQLLADARTSENLAVTWTNLLIGRSNARGVDEQSLYAFLLEQFSENRPWMETVGQLIAAEGRSDQNGATNFLLAHLNDQATPATAVTARLFLGEQVHCTQCHDHPFSKERSQHEFWSLNAFFKQAERRQISVTDAGGTEKQVWELADNREAGMTFYDTLRGQKKAVLPEFDGQSISAAETGSRRTILVRMLASDRDHQVARAMVNRMWAHAFGYGFTNPIDDLGPHNPASHPELLDHLTQAFVQSDYDVRRLLRWLTLSEAFQLSSIQAEPVLAIDDPQEGGTPLFSRAYPRHMGPEQVYESIRIAIRSVSQQPIESSVGTAHRRQWVDQFVQSYGTDENDENLGFEGNLSEAMLMMNGQDLQDAIPLAAVEMTKAVRNGSAAPGEAIQRLALATLNRSPSEKEEKAFRNRYRSLSRSLAPDEAMKTATEDMLWAYLNSSEFVSLH